MTQPAESGLIRLVAPIREQVVEVIRRQIFSGELQPGQRLIERELTEKLRVSRNTLREAYRQLEAEGFLLLAPHKGPVVTELGPKEARAVYEAREAIECFAVQLFVERSDDEQIERLVDRFAELRMAHTSGNITAILEAKNRFYGVLYEGSDNHILKQQANILQGRLMRLRVASLSRPGRLWTSLSEIELVLNRIQARDAIGARELWQTHIQHAAAAALAENG